MSSQAPSISTFKFAASVKFGAGALSQLGPAVREAGAGKVLVVADPGVVQAGLAGRAIAAIQQAGLQHALFSDVQPNPTDANVAAGAAACRAAACDIIVAVGGGSVIDAAKGIRVMAAHPGSISAYFAGPGASPIDQTMPHLIAIPTTAGTGSEVTGAAVITDTAQKRKRFVVAGLPYLALVDPELTGGMPPRLTADSGMDALTHCIEGYVSNRFSPFGASVALSGIRLVAGNLVRAYRNGADREARSQMSLAALLGGAAFGMLGTGLGAAHSLAHQLSTEAGVSHGMANAVILPYVMRYSIEAAPQRYAEVAQALGMNTWGFSPLAAAQKGIEAVQRLCADVGIPPRLRDAGVSRDSIAAMAQNAFVDGVHRNGPRPCTQEDLAALYETAW